MNNKSIINDLREIIEDNLDPSMFPYQKGNSIRIGKIVIRKNKQGYLLYDITTGDRIAKTFCKTAAVAIAKTLTKGKDVKTEVLYLDKVIEKHYNDCIFYKNTLVKSKDFTKKDIIMIRYDIAKQSTETARERLDKYIFS